MGALYIFSTMNHRHYQSEIKHHNLAIEKCYENQLRNYGWSYQR